MLGAITSLAFILIIAAMVWLFTKANRFSIITGRKGKELSLKEKQELMALYDVQNSVGGGVLTHQDGTYVGSANG